MNGTNTRRSWLRVFDVVLLVAAVVAGLAALGALVNAVTSDNVGALTIPLPDSSARGSLLDGVDLLRAEAVVDAPTGLGYRLSWWVTGPGTGILVAAGALVLRDIVATARAGDPFVAANVRRLRTLALLVVGHSVLSLAAAAVAIAIQKDIGVEHASARASGFQIALACALLALAEVWRRGVDLREEQQLTV